MKNSRGKMNYFFIEKARKVCGYTMVQLEKKLSTPRTRLSVFAAGKAGLTLFYLNRWAAKLNVSPPLLMLACSEVPDEFTPDEVECFTTLRAIARGNILAAFSGRRIKKRRKGEMTKYYDEKGWHLPENEEYK